MRIRATRKSFVATALAEAAALFAVQGPAQMPSGPRPPARTLSPSADLSASFQQPDANRNGAIDKKEAARVAGLSPVFDMADANHDGTLDRAEFDAAGSMMK